MKKHKVKYTDEPIGEIKIVKDFLPRTKDLVFTKKDYSEKTEPLSTQRKNLFFA